MHPGRRLWIGIPGPELDAKTSRHLADVRPGAIVLFRRNITSSAQTRALIVALRELLGPDLHVAVDQEHGLVVRFDRELTVFPGAMALGATGMREPSLAEHLAFDCARAAAAELAALGIDVQLAPVADLATRGDNPGLGVRSFSRHARLAGRLVASTVRGATEAGVASVLKHFPGLGGAAVDSHEDLPRADVGDLNELLEPFAAGIAAGVDLVMSTHCAFPELDGATPATFSAVLQRGLLRERLGFRGVLMTDDLEMGAMTRRFGFDEVVRRAAPLHEVLCICHDADKQSRARDLLAEMGDPDPEMERRLDALRKATVAARRGVNDPGPLVRTDKAERLSAAVAGRAVTVVRDPAALLPLRSHEPVALLLPSLAERTGAEDPFRGESLDELRAGFPAGSLVLDVPKEPTAVETADLLAAVRPFRRCLLGTALAKFRPAEASFVRAVAAAHPGLIVVALRNPFDLDVVSAESAAACVTAYGFRPVHQRALLAVLFGRVEAYGRLPV